jgi:hypothetical protein
MCYSNSYKANYKNSTVWIKLIALEKNKSIKTTANVQFRKQQGGKTTISTLHNKEKHTDNKNKKNNKAVLRKSINVINNSSD